MLEPLLRSRYEQIAGTRPPIRIFLTHYGSQIMSKVWAGLSKVPKFVWVLLGLSILIPAISIPTYNRRQETDRRQQEADRRQEEDKAKAEKRRIDWTQEWARKYLEDWKTAFLGDLTIVCAEIYTYPNLDGKAIFAYQCQIGQKNQLPTKGLSCTWVGCTLSNL